MKPDPATVVIAALESRGLRVQANGRSSWRAQCPCADAHTSGDTHPSLSVTAGTRDNRPNVLLNCKRGCHNTDILSALGLTWRELLPDRPREQWTASSGTRPATTRPAALTQVAAPPPEPLPTPAQMREYQQALARALGSSRTAKGWSLATLQRLHCGLDGNRIVIPITDAAGHLQSVCLYNTKYRVKMIAARGRPRDLFPAPELMPGSALVVCEGEPDAISLAEMGLTGVAIPAVSKWRTQGHEWCRRLATGRTHIVIAADSDAAGREHAHNVADGLLAHDPRLTVKVVDLHPRADDKYDVGDLLLEHLAKSRNGAATARHQFIQEANAARPATIQQRAAA